MLAVMVAAVPSNACQAGYEALKSPPLVTACASRRSLYNRPVFASAAVRPIVLAALLTACGGDDVGPADGAVLDAESDGGLDVPNVAPPDIPWLDDGVPPLMFTPCPEGWREVTEAGVTTCDPYPEGGPSECAFGEAHFVGEPGCRPVGDPCPAGDWPAELPSDDSVVFVQAGASGGDGSRSAPFGRLDEVPWGVRGTGWTVALAKGSYEGVLPLRAGVQVIGACVAETHLSGIGLPVSGVLMVTSRGEPASVRNLSIVDAPQFGVDVADGGALSLLGVAIVRATGVGLRVSDGASEVEATDVLVEGTRPFADGRLGQGVDIRAARFVGTRLVVAANHAVGLGGRSGANVTLTDVAVAGTESQQFDATYGDGVTALGGTQLAATRLWVAGNRTTGVVARGSSTITLADAVVRDTRAQERDGNYGSGLFVGDGAHLEATRLLASHNRMAGVLALDGGSITLSDVVVHDTQGQERDGTLGRGIGVQSSRLEATRLLVSDNRDAGIFIAEPDSRATLTDVVVRDTDGGGLIAQSGVRLEVTRLLVSGSRHVGVLASSTTGTITDAVVRDTRNRLSDGALGYGFSVQYDGDIEASRLRLATSCEVGLFVGAATFRGSDVEIEHVSRAACDGGERMYGYGAAVFDATATLERFAIRQAETCGLFVVNVRADAALDVRHGVVEGSAIGACVQVEGYDLDRLTEDVLYRDNDANLEATMLPVPELPLPFGP